MNTASAPSSADQKPAVIETRAVDGAPRSFRRRVDQWLLGKGSPERVRFLHRLVALLRLPAPDTSQLIRRVIRMERDIVLPIKAAGIAMLIASFFFSHWIGLVLDALAIAVEATRSFLLVYILVNVVTATALFAVRSLPTAVVEWSVMITSLIDGILLATLTLVTGGYSSVLYWVFLALIIRVAVSVPRATWQLTINFTLTACYMLAGYIDIRVAETLPSETPTTPAIIELTDNPTQSLVLRLALLLLMTFCCYGVQVLLERHRRIEEEAREFAVREAQLRSAGRLAAEIAHQIKNPLGIMNTALFSLQRALREGKGDPGEQVRIIREEIERSDRIITEVMGYAQLSEGRVEKLNVREELDRAMAEVFPPGAGYKIKLHWNYAESFPPLLMQRKHFCEVLVNLLQNAREALAPRGGNIYVDARCLPDYSIAIAIRDDGPGIPADKHERIFEPYYTTKEKGTGLGLAAVKHNVELYGGSIRLESELGKGAAFNLLFPGKTLMRLDNKPLK
jgi:signal transduction histidine kinase